MAAAETDEVAMMRVDLMKCRDRKRELGLPPMAPTCCSYHRSQRNITVQLIDTLNDNRLIPVNNIT